MYSAMNVSEKFCGVFLQYLYIDAFWVYKLLVLSVMLFREARVTLIEIGSLHY